MAVFIVSKVLMVYIFPTSLPPPSLLLSLLSSPFRPFPPNSNLFYIISAINLSCDADDTGGDGGGDDYNEQQEERQRVAVAALKSKLGAIVKASDKQAR